MEVFKIFEFNNLDKNKIFIVLIGAMIGAVFRFQVNNDFWSNLLGCGLLGLIVGCRLDEKVQIFFSIGLCSALTSFSGWIFSALQLFMKGFFWHAVFLLFLNFIAGFLSLTACFFMGRQIKQSFMP